MIRPISLFLFACLSLSEFSTSTNVAEYGVWTIILLCVIPAIALLVAPKASQLKFGIAILTFTILIAWGIALFVFGWMEYARGYVGNYIVNDEVVILLPPVLSLSLLWWITSPMEKRFAWVSHRLRIDVLLLLVPVLFVWGVREAVRFYAHPESPLQNAGIVMIIAIIILSPIYIRFILSAKDMQDKALLRTIVETGHFAGIRNPRVYVWNTHQLLMNAFAIGVFFTPKTIILTDKLIKNLTQSELLAVVRHEFAHHRYWHLPFLFLSMICALIWSDYLLNLLQLDLGSGYVQVAQLLLMMIVFVVMSKQFERQADAYAAVDYSKKIGSSVVTEDALQSMKTALSAIAYSNNISMDRNDLLHGSIHERQLNLGAIVGCPLDKIPINRKVRVIKIATILFLLLGIVI